MQIGFALSLYEKTEGVFPFVPQLVEDPPREGGPLKTLLASLAIPDLAGLADGLSPPERRPSEIPGMRSLPGFICPSDLKQASEAGFPAPVSYRGATGDSPEGSNGGFAPGRLRRLADLEEADGAGYTAAFSERLLGTGSNNDRGPVSYLVVRSPIPKEGCNAMSSPVWHGDTGWSWAEPSYRSTLYNHALTPNASPSCITLDGAEAFLGASSAHMTGVNVLLFDGSVRTISPTIAAAVWKALATIQPSAKEVR